MEIKNRLKVMLFLQYFIWGSWLITFASYMINGLKFSSIEVGIVFSSKGIAAIVMPCLLGIIADKWVKANLLYLICHLVGAAALFAAIYVNNYEVMFWVMLINAMAYMPTIALSNSISYYCLDKNKLNTLEHFPSVRVFGTVGFIAAMWLVDIMGFAAQKEQLLIASGAAFVLALYTLTLPQVVTEKRAPATNLISKLGLDAFVLFKKRNLAIFFVFATLLGAVLQITNMYGSPFLQDLAKNPLYFDSPFARYTSILLSVSQMSEVVFILAIPFFLKRFGIKKVIIISMIAWVLRFALFAYGDFSYFGASLLLLSMIVYGCAFDFFNVSGSMFIEREVGSELRASAQGLFMTMVNGVGAYIGAILSGFVIHALTTDGVRDWQSIWLIFAGYALVLAVLFTILFHYKQDESSTS